MLVHHRALVDASVAGRARPDPLVRTDGLEHVRQAVYVPSYDRAALVVQRIPDVRDDSHRVERLASRVRRARSRAASALRARVPIEKLPPRELLDPVHTERLRLL